MQQLKIIDLIGEGSFGSVYLAKDQQGQDFALKKIQFDPFEIEQVRRQIDAMKKFHHPNLLRIHDYVLNQQTSQLQILMEYCPEGDLAKHLRSHKRLPAEEVVEIFRQIFRAFLLMTVRGVIHRDLKPENVLIGAGKVIKIADFGCARSLGEVDISRAQNLSLDKGTFIYASPQQLRNEEYSFKCDVWSAGCIAYLLYFGYHPFIDSKPHHTLSNISTLTQDKTIQLDPDSDSTVAKLIASMLIWEERDRATWSELWLARVFAPKVKDVRRFVSYLKNLSSIASWLTKQFWKIRKEFKITKNNDEIFIYFLIKFQWTNLKKALKILKKSQSQAYLFEEAAYKAYQPSQQQFNQVKKSYLQHQKYFATIRKSMEGKESWGEIEAKEMKRQDAWADLDRSTRAAYKIISEIRGQLETHPSRDSKVWQVFVKWVTFMPALSYEAFPVLQDLLKEPTGQVMEQVRVELQRYEKGELL